MIRHEDIRSIIVDGEEFSAFKLGTKDGGMPNHLFQGDKKDGMLIRDGKVEPWMWKSIHYEGNDRYVYFDKMDLHSLEEIATTRRKHALRIVLNIAVGLNSADASWLNLETGVFPLYRIFIVNESDVLLLPPDIGTVVGLLRTPDERRDEVNVLIKKGNEATFLLIAEMAELLYFSLTGFLPYLSEEVRHWKYREFPIENIGHDNAKAVGLINVILHAKRQQMRDIGGNRSSAEALSWFIKNASTLEWTAENRDTVPAPESYSGWDEWNEKTEKGSARNTFWRKKGAFIIGITITVGIVLGLVGNWLYRFLQPPVTKDMDQEEIVMSVYEAMNELDPELLDAATKGTQLPQDMDVINLFVSTRVRGAYERSTPVHDPNDWIAEGRPALPQGDLIYGVTDVELERIDEHTIVAYADWWSPWLRDDESEEYDPLVAPTTIEIQVEPMRQTFVFEWNDRGWWNITWSDITPNGEIGMIEIPVIAKIPDNRIEGK